MKRIAMILGIFIVLFAGCLSCTPSSAPAPPTPSPAAFEVISLDIIPPEVVAGETVNITAEVRNTGGSEGSYTAILTVEGAAVETKEVMLAPGTSKTVSFSLVKDNAGVYQVGIGGLTSSLTVKEKLVLKEVELKYDDGTAKDYLSAGPDGGYLVDFFPPTAPFTIKKVRICGGLWGSGWEGKNFRVEIWDKDYKILYTATYSVTKFTVNATTWVEVEVPGIAVSDKFYVHVYTGTGKMAGIHLGADDSVANKHSEMTARTAEGVSAIRSDWPYSTSYWFGDKSKVNWMIRVVGTIIEVH